MAKGKLLTTRGRGRFPLSPGPTPVPPTSLPRNLVTGLLARSFDTGTGPQRPLIDGMVLQLTWEESQPTSGSSLDTTVMNNLISQLDWCASNTGTSGRPIPVRLRIEAGLFSPQWVKTAAGNMPWYVSQGPSAVGPPAPSDPKWLKTPTNMPMWWKPAFISAYETWIVKLAQAISAHPALGEVTMALPMTSFVEPFIKEFYCLENRTAAVAAGFTQELDTAAFMAGWNVHQEAFGPQGVATHTAFNPAQEVFVKSDSTLGARSNVAYTMAMMEKNVGVNSRMTIVANNSLQNPIENRGAEYIDMYNRMIAGRAQTTPFPWPIAFQTATLAKIQADYAAQGTTVPGTIDMALAWGATGVELPRGCENSTAGRDYISPAMAKTYNTAFWNQSQTLMQGGSTPPPPPPPPPGGTPDSEIPTASTGLYFIEGAIWADPQGNGNGTTAATSTAIIKPAGSTIRLHRRKPSNGTINLSVRQFGDAALAIGGTVSYSVNTSGDDVAAITIPVDINIAFNTAPAILTGATGLQKRAFVAAAVQGEGSQTGLLVDDPELGHINVIKDIVNSVDGYSIPTRTEGTNSFALYIDSPDDYWRIQLYPFAVWGRTPGGDPGW